LVAKTLSLLVFVAVPVLAVGCKGQPPIDPEIQLQKSELSEIHDIYKQYLKNYGRPPKQLSDLDKLPSLKASPGGLQAFQKGQYIVVWGVDIDKEAGMVLAYEKDAPKQGGVVLLADGSVRKMSAEEFKAAPKKK
jgi:hypothetical protein